MVWSRTRSRCWHRPGCYRRRGSSCRSSTGRGRYGRRWSRGWRWTGLRAISAAGCDSSIIYRIRDPFPDNHLTASPDRRVKVPAWEVRGGCSRSDMPDSCQCFSYCSDHSALDVLASTLEANEIDYAGDTPAAIVTGITDRGYNAHL